MITELCRQMPPINRKTLSMNSPEIFPCETWLLLLLFVFWAHLQLNTWRRFSIRNGAKSPLWWKLVASDFRLSPTKQPSLSWCSNQSTCAKGKPRTSLLKELHHLLSRDRAYLNSTKLFFHVLFFCLFHFFGLFIFLNEILFLSFNLKNRLIQRYNLPSISFSLSAVL